MNKKQRTASRLFSHLRGQKIRLTVVIISVIVYVGLSIYTPMYSAIFIDQLWAEVQLAWSNGTVFAVTWDGLGSALLWLTAVYFLLGFFIICSRI